MEFKACPFCESTDIEIAWHEQIGFWATCNNCYATGGNAETEGEAIEAWNRRCGQSAEDGREPVLLG